MIGTSTKPDNIGLLEPAATESTVLPFSDLTSREKSAGGLPTLTLFPQPAEQKTNIWARRWAAFRYPLNGEKESYLKARWESLPDCTKTPNQISGRHLTHCGFTLGASYCSFHCTHCYLPKNANSIPIPSLAQMKEQIDANRRLQGPGAGLQITGGDVADAYWRSGRQDELVEIIRYAYSVGLVPMLFTHGQTLFEQPQFLEKLVVEAGLRQVAVHIDMTQAGRKGYPIQRVTSEADLHPIRQQFTDLALGIRERTGATLEFAHNCTVTRRNIEHVPEIIRWFMADPNRSLVWRMLSFQPEADTGRTIYSEKPITPGDVWAKIQEGSGFLLRRDATIFGHADCNSWAPLLIARPSGLAMPIIADNRKLDRFLSDILAKTGGLSLVNDDANTPPWRLAGILFKNPGFIFRGFGAILSLLRNGLIPKEMLRAIFKGQVHTMNIGIHNFMDASQVANADHDPVIKCRLDACVFKGAVKRNGEWEAVPMCSMNQKAWGEVYEDRLQDPNLVFDIKH